MGADGTPTATPRLRFPEFRERTGWTSARLGQLAVLVTERVGATDCTPYTVATGVGLVSQQERFGRTIAGNSLKNYVVLRRNDFAYNKSATKAFPQGFIARHLRDERAAVPTSIFTCFRVDAGAIDPAYLEYLFASNLHGRWLRNYITVGARAHGSLNVNDGDLMALPVPLPAGTTSLREQQTIAACLASLDEAIIAQGRKLAVLKAHKRGLLQGLFPQEGERLPRLRFPEFRDGPAWKDTTFGEIIDPQSGGTPSKANPVYWNGTIPWVSAKDMKRLFLEDTEDHITAAAVDDGAKQVPAGTVLVLTRGMTLLNDVPICVLRRDMSFNQDVKALRPKGDLDGRFLPHLLEGHKQRLLRIVDLAGHGTGRLNTERLKALDVMLPPLPAEQRRIADCLYPINAVLPAESEKLDALKLHKKVLMQQLFPVPEARL
jgi:type I restriction enzyme, S subunit